MDKQKLVSVQCLKGRGRGASSTVYDYKELTNSTDPHTYDGPNRDAAIAAVSGGYDARGNLTSEGAGGWTFTYDIENHLLTATGGSANLNLDYDPEGRLNQITSGGVVTKLLYDGAKLIGEYNSSGVMTERYVFGEGTDDPIVWYHGSGLTDRRYFITNYQGSVVGYTTASDGSLQALYKYGPYGEPKTSGNQDSWNLDPWSVSAPRFRYTGQLALPEARLYYYKARVYDPKYGRFLQTDPIGSDDDLDLYAYVGEDPINGSDPLGLMGADSNSGDEHCHPISSDGDDDGCTATVHMPSVTCDAYGCIIRNPSGGTPRLEEATILAIAARQFEFESNPFTAGTSNKKCKHRDSDGVCAVANPRDCPKGEFCRISDPLTPDGRRGTDSPPSNRDPRTQAQRATACEARGFTYDYEHGVCFESSFKF